MWEHEYDPEDCKCGLYEGVPWEEDNDFEQTVAITPAFERQCWRDGSVMYGGLRRGGLDKCGEYPTNLSPPVLCEADWHSYELHYLNFDWQNQNGE